MSTVESRYAKLCGFIFPLGVLCSKCVGWDNERECRACANTYLNQIPHSEVIRTGVRRIVPCQIV